MQQHFIRELFASTGLVALLVAVLVMSACVGGNSNDAADGRISASPDSSATIPASPAEDETTAASPAASPTTTPPASAAQGTVVIDPALRDTEWILISINDDPVIEGVDITLKFEAKVISGWAGCNSYTGGDVARSATEAPQDVVVADGIFEIPESVHTDRGCPTPELTELENRYFGVLADVTRYHLDGDQLRLKTDDRRALLFRRDA